MSAPLEHVSRFLTSLAKAVSAMTLYQRSHPAVDRAVQTAFEDIVTLQTYDALPVLTFLGDEVVYRDRPIKNLRSWEWGERLAEVGVQRLECHGPVTQRDFDTFVDALFLRLSDTDVEHPPPEDLWSIRFGMVGLKNMDQSLSELGEELIGYSLSEEIATMKWLDEECRTGGKLHLLEADTIVRSLAVAMHADVELMVPLVHLKGYDQYTTTHSLNISVLSMALGEFLGLPSKYVRRLGVAGLLHDIGKTRVSKELLNKGGKLDRDEREAIEAHPVEGARILIEREANMDLAATVAYEHHIRFDGGGYPKRRFKRRCHPASNLVHLCDVYDALRTHRPYRKAWGQDRVLEYIEDGLGSEFDPGLGRAFLEMMHRWGSRLYRITSQEDAVGIGEADRPEESTDEAASPPALPTQVAEPVGVAQTVETPEAVGEAAPVEAVGPAESAEAADPVAPIAAADRDPVAGTSEAAAPDEPEAAARAAATSEAAPGESEAAEAAKAARAARVAKARKAAEEAKAAKVAREQKAAEAAERARKAAEQAKAAEAARAAEEAKAQKAAEEAEAAAEAEKARKAAEQAKAAEAARAAEEAKAQKAAEEAEAAAEAEKARKAAEQAKAAEEAKAQKAAEDAKAAEEAKAQEAERARKAKRAKKAAKAAAAARAAELARADQPEPASTAAPAARSGPQESVSDGGEDVETTAHAPVGTEHPGVADGAEEPDHPATEVFDSQASFEKAATELGITDADEQMFAALLAPDEMNFAPGETKTALHRTKVRACDPVTEAATGLDDVEGTDPRVLYEEAAAELGITDADEQLFSALLAPEEMNFAPGETKTAQHKTFANEPESEPGLDPDSAVCTAGDGPALEDPPDSDAEWSEETRSSWGDSPDEADVSHPDSVLAAAATGVVLEAAVTEDCDETEPVSREASIQARRRRRAKLLRRKR